MKKCTEHNENGTHASFRRPSPRGGDSSQGARALCYGLQRRAVFNMGRANWNFPAFPVTLLLSVRVETAQGLGVKTESRCPQCWGRVRSPAVENRGSGTESSFPSSCSRWGTAPPGRLRHKWYTASSPTGSWAGRSPWTWSGWTTGLDSTVWGSGGPGVTTGGSTWSLRVGPPSRAQISDVTLHNHKSPVYLQGIRHSIQIPGEAFGKGERKRKQFDTLLTPPYKEPRSKHPCVF